MIYLMNECSIQRRERERDIKWLLVAHCFCLLLLSAAGMEPAGSEWNERAEWSCCQSTFLNAANGLTSLAPAISAAATATITAVSVAGLVRA